MLSTGTTTFWVIYVLKNILYFLDSMKVKILSFLLCLTLSWGAGHAQDNLREGIVITLQGDTLYGQIDYRTDAKNAQQCCFLSDDASDVHIYKPGEITAYRFLDNGRFYVSRSVPLPDGLQRTCFLEYVLSGKMSLYTVRIDAKDYHFLEDESGQLARFREETEVTSPKDRRNNLASALVLLTASKRAQKELYEKGTSLGNVIRVVRMYNDEVCPDGTCQLFQYKAKKTPKADRIKWHPTVQFGYGYFGTEDKSEVYLASEYRIDETTHWSTNYALQAAVGAEFYCPRISQHMLVQLRFSFLHVSLEERKTNTKVIYSPETEQVIGPITRVLKHNKFLNIATLKFGPAYECHWGPKIRPRIGGGLFTCSFFPMGLYASGGVGFPMRKGAILCEADFNSPMAWSTNTFYGSISMGYQF